jgi:predicted transcriptional regulator
MKKDLEKLKSEVLSLIAQNDGELTWFGISRTIVDEEFLPVIDRLGEIFAEIENQELAVKSESQRYRITDKGRKWLSDFRRRPLPRAA